MAAASGEARAAGQQLAAVPVMCRRGKMWGCSGGRYMVAPMSMEARYDHSSTTLCGSTTPTEMAMSCDAAWKKDQLHCTIGGSWSMPARYTHESSRNP